MATRRRARAKSAAAEPAAPPRRKQLQREQYDEMRRVSGLLYIQDKDGHSIEWHWEHGPARRHIGFKEFRIWSAKAHWYEQRIEYWRDVQYRTIEQMKARDVARVVEQVDRLEDLSDAIFKMLQPVQGPDGKILLDNRGLPCFHVALPPYDRLVKALLDVDARRDGYGERITDHILREKGSDSDGVLVQQGQVIDVEAQLTADEAREMARWLLMRRHKQLAADNQHDANVQQEDGDG